MSDGLVYLCRASGEGSHEFRVCADEASVGAFYQEMTGEDEGGGIDSLWRDFRDPDCWGSDGTALELELYCAKFEVWKVDARQLTVAPSAAAARTYWLIERGSPCEWWAGTDTAKHWTSDVSKVHPLLKFPTKEGAEYEADRIKYWPTVIGSELRITEHMDCAGPDLAPQSATALIYDRRGEVPILIDRDDVIEECADVADQKLTVITAGECTYICDVADAIRALKSAATDRSADAA